MEVRAFGPLKGFVKESPLHMEIPKGGTTGLELLKKLGIPRELVECVMVDGKANDLDFKIVDAERVAFIPYGTPGPYRVFLNIKRQRRPDGTR
jgi:molybdopterin converting factor small subunit